MAYIYMALLVIFSLLIAFVEVHELLIPFVASNMLYTNKETAQKRPVLYILIAYLPSISDYSSSCCTFWLQKLRLPWYSWTGAGGGEGGMHLEPLPGVKTLNMKWGTKKRKGRRCSGGLSREAVFWFVFIFV